MTVHIPKRLVPGKMTIEKFLEFLEFRPDEEKWELIEGYPMMMAPASNAHQRIGLNLCYLLDDALEAAKLDLKSLPDIGLKNPDLDTFLPVPDVAVVPGDATDAIYRQDYWLAAQVLSPSNTRKLVRLKLDRYMQAPDCRYILVIEAKRMGVELYRRSANWTREVLGNADAVLEIEEFGFKCRVRDLYRRTYLDPSGSR